MSKFTSNYAVDLLIRGLDENPDLNKIVYYAISDQYSGAATALSGSLSDVPVVRETIKNAGVVKIDHSIKNELVDTVINVLDPETKSNNINRRVRSLIDDVLNFASQKDGSNDILSMFQNVIPAEVTTEHPDTDWDSVLYWILVRSVLVPIVKIPLDKNGKPIIIQDTKKESASKKTTTFGKRVARMGEEPQKEKKEEPESKETPSEPIVNKPEEKETPEPNFVIVDTPKPTLAQAVDSKTGDVVNVEVIAPDQANPTTRKAAAKTFKHMQNNCTTPISCKNIDVSAIQRLSETELNQLKMSVIRSIKSSLQFDPKFDEYETQIHPAFAQYCATLIIERTNFLDIYIKCPDYYQTIAKSIFIKLVAPKMDSRINVWEELVVDEYISKINLCEIHDCVAMTIMMTELNNGNLISALLDKIYRSTELIDTTTLEKFIMDYFYEQKLDLSKYKSEINNMISDYNLFAA